LRIWVDCTAAAHPLVLRPIVQRLQGLGHEVRITAREYGQTLGILERLGMPYERIGRHGGRSSLAKGTALARRSAALTRWARRAGFDLAIGHGSVDLAVVSTLLRIPSAQMQDYEHAGLQRQVAFRVARRVLVPDAIPPEAMKRAGASPEKLVRYPGLKEDYYLADFEPDPAVPEALGLDRDEILVVVRPPPETSAYHAPNALYEAVLDRLGNEKGVQTVIIPRTERQRHAVERRVASGEWRAARAVVPNRAIDSQSLIAFSDLVVGAGGTMNREAVALGTPVYTIFSGRMGAVDQRLIAEGAMRELRRPDDLELRKRDAPVGVCHPRDPAPLVEGILGAVE
jgi:predicted glycosyltransferase